MQEEAEADTGRNRKHRTEHNVENLAETGKITKMETKAVRRKIQRIHKTGKSRDDKNEGQRQIA